MDSSNNEGVNPLTALPNPFEPYEQSSEANAKEVPEVFEIGRLCFEIFLINEHGKKLMGLMENKFLFGSLLDPTHPVAPNMGMYWAGYTDCIKFLRSNAIEHKKRILADERK